MRKPTAERLRDTRSHQGLNKTTIMCIRRNFECAVLVFKTKVLREAKMYANVYKQSNSYHSMYIRPFKYFTYISCNPPLNFAQA